MRQIPEIISDLVRIRRRSIAQGYTNYESVLEGGRKASGDEIREIIQKNNNDTFILELYEMPFRFLFYVDGKATPPFITLTFNLDRDMNSIKDAFANRVLTEILEYKKKNFLHISGYENMKEKANYWETTYKALEIWIENLKISLTVPYFLYSRNPLSKERTEELCKAFLDRATRISTLKYELQETWFWENRPNIGDPVVYGAKNYWDRKKGTITDVFINPVSGMGCVKIKTEKGEQVQKYLSELPTLREAYQKTILYQDMYIYENSPSSLPKRWEKY